MMPTGPAVQREFARLLDAARDLPEDLEAEVSALLHEGADEVVDAAEALALLDRVLDRLDARVRDDDAMVAAVSAGARTLRDSLGDAPMNGDGRRDGLQPASLPRRHPVRPTPRFAGLQIPMWRLQVSPRDVMLWELNDRTEVHVEQFRKLHGREPRQEELLSILLSKANLEGVAGGDEFEITELANDIAAFGLERPPILGHANEIIDGNRRVAACLMILTDSTYDAEARKRVQTIEVHQLSEHATPEDAEWVVTTLNFRRDQKKEWSDYIKARKIYAEWQRMTQLRPDATSRELGEMRKELARRFAMGNRTDTVARFIRMIDLAEQFETFMVEEREHDPFTVRHRAMDRFQFFDELTKGSGKRTQGAQHALDQSDRLRETVFDLLFDGKFANWNLVRDLKFVPENVDVLDELDRAVKEEDQKKAQRMVRNALTEARQNSPEAVETSSDLRISTFVSWLEKLSVTGFRRSVSSESLRRLQHALRLVESMVERLLEEREAAERLNP